MIGSRADSGALRLVKYKEEQKRRRGEGKREGEEREREKKRRGKERRRGEYNVWKDGIRT